MTKRYSVTCDLCLQSSIPPAWCGRMSWFFIAYQETCNTFGFHTICIQNRLHHICSFQSFSEQLQGDDTLPTDKQRHMYGWKDSFTKHIYVWIYSDLIQSIRCALNSLLRNNVMTVRLEAENFMLETESWHKTGGVSIRHYGNRVWRLSIVGLCHMSYVIYMDSGLG